MVKMNPIGKIRRPAYRGPTRRPSPVGQIGIKETGQPAGRKRDPVYRGPTATLRGPNTRTTREEYLEVLNNPDKYTLLHDTGGGSQVGGVGGSISGGLGAGGLEAEARQAVEEAKAKQEASKESALGYYEDLYPQVGATGKGLGMGYERAAGILSGMEPAIEQARQRQLGYYQPLLEESRAIDPNIISDEQMAKLLANRRAQLAATSQGLAGQFTDPYSGAQTGERLGIARNIGIAAADLPIELQLQVGQANRAAQLQRLGQIGDVSQRLAGVESENILRKLGLAGTQVGVEQEANRNLLALLGVQKGIAGSMAGVQQAYQYDPGLGMIQQLGQALGQQQAGAGTGSTSGGYTTPTGVYGGSSKPTSSTLPIKPADNRDSYINDYIGGTRPDFGGRDDSIYTPFAGSQGYGYRPPVSGSSETVSPAWFDSSQYRRLGRIR